MVCLLLNISLVVVFSNRKVVSDCERNLAFVAIVGTDRPDLRTISMQRKNHLDALPDVFMHVIRLAKVAGLDRLGMFAFAGTKIKIQGNDACARR
jgi:hypothetical protein